MKILLLLALVFATPLLALDQPGAKSVKPEGKSGKRIDQIEKDFGVKFVQVAQVSVGGKKASLWVFAHSSDESAPVYAFSTPENPTDTVVQNCMASSNYTALFYLYMIKSMKDAQPTPTPTNLL